MSDEPISEVAARPRPIPSGLRCGTANAALCRCWPGCRRRFRSAASPSATDGMGGRGRRRARTRDSTSPGSARCSITARYATMPCWPRSPGAPCEPGPAGLAEVDDAGPRLAGSRERRLETTAQGNAFVTRHPRRVGARRRLELGLGRLSQRCRLSRRGRVACAAPWHSASRRRSRPTASPWCRNSSRPRSGSMPLGQTDGQRAIAALLPRTQKLAREAQHATLDDVGGAAFRSDIAALRHETQYTRLFRS